MREKIREGKDRREESWSQVSHGLNEHFNTV